MENLQEENSNYPMTIFKFKFFARAFDTYPQNTSSHKSEEVDMDYGMNTPEHRALSSLELAAYEEEVEREMAAYRPACLRPACHNTNES